MIAAQNQHFPGWVGGVEWVVPGVGVGLSGECPEGVDGQELTGGWVVIAGVEVVEAGLVVDVLAGVLQVSGGRSCVGRRSVGGVGVGAGDGGGAVEQGSG